MQRWTEVNPQEKVYLHLDKPYYALGDTIWFKAYATTGSRHQLSALSGALYVDLITEKDSIVKSLKLPLAAGMSMGDFTLDDDLTAGNYRIRAYTQWMRNAGEDYFFDRTFAVGTPVSDEVLVKSAYQYKVVDGKSVLTALLNYRDEQGRALSNQVVEYDIMIDKQRAYSKSAKTDTGGNISIVIPSDKQPDLRGAYIRTRLETTGTSNAGVGIKKKVIKDFPINAELSQTDVQFFPESGNLVNGILSRVAFKATGIDGKGVAVKGRVVDNANKEITEIETLHAGMGSFLLQPQAGTTYAAVLTFADGSEKTFSLPKAIDDAYVLSVYQPNKDSILVRVSTTPGLLKAANGLPINLNFIAQTGGETVIASPVKITRQLTSFWLQKSAFPSGIVQFTLFDQAGQPLNERLVFVKTKDQMQLKLSSSKNTYKSKEKVEVELESRDRNDKPTAGNFSVTVVDEGKVPIDAENEHTIFSNLLLTADLKGYVEQPNYYFSEDKEEVDKALDNLMLTQGYRRFVWKELAADPNTAYLTNPLFAKESLGTDISGVVKTLTGKVVPNAKLMLISTKIGVFESATADANGRFKFEGLVLTDSIKFAVQARTEKNGTKVEVVLDSVPKLLLGKNKNIADVNTNILAIMKSYLENSKKLDDFYEKTGQLNRVQRLKEVNISARKATPLKYAAQGQFQIPEGHADQTYIITKPELCANLGICLQGQLGGVIFKEYKCSDDETIQNYPTYRNVRMLTVLDGRLVRGCDELQGIYDANVLDPTDIVKIEIIKTNAAFAAEIGPDGPIPTIYIYTNRGLPKKSFNPSIANLSPKGFNKAREFYSPRYDKQGSDNIFDYRSTIYWNANLKTYSTGKTSFSFFNADGPGNYKVIVEGINAEGELGRKVIKYVVEAGDATVPIPSSLIATNTVTQALDSVRKMLPSEKVYLHTDKQNYLVGDTVWFKGYVIAGNTGLLSTWSAALYIDLINEADSIAQTRKLPLIGGVTNGDFILDDSTTKEGNYRIRAYTQWMRNAGPDYFYDRTFSVGNSIANTVFSKISYSYETDGSNTRIKALLKYTDEKGAPYVDKEVTYNLKESYKSLATGSGRTNALGELLVTLPKSKPGELQRSYLATRLSIAKNLPITKTFPLKASRFETDVQFFPEGGTMLNGINNKVAFKATGTNGLGVLVKGTIVDEKENVVSQITTQHLGMGFFFLTPQAGMNYTAKVSYPDGTTHSFPLPVASDNGYLLSIAPKGTDSISVVVKAAKLTFQPNQKLLLVGQSNATTRFTQDITLSSNSSTLHLPVRDYPSGILQVTLFSADFKPLNERLVFLQNSDTLCVNVFDIKPQYTQREKVDFQLESKMEASNPVAGNFSISVVNEAAMPFEHEQAHSIFSQLLLVSDLKGYIEKPNYYFTNVSVDTKANLDLLMLTQGYRRFIWKDIIDKKIDLPTYSAEKTITRITGKLTTLKNLPVQNGKLMLFNNKNSMMLNAVSNQEGRFAFDNVSIPDGMKFTIQGRTATGSNRLNTVLDLISVQEVTSNVNQGDVNPNIPELIKASMEVLHEQDLALEKSGKISRANQLREVQIKAPKKWGFGTEINESQADEVFRPDPRRPCKTLMECLVEMDKTRVRFDQKIIDSSPCWIPMFGKEEYFIKIDGMLVFAPDYQSVLLDDVSNIDKIYFAHEGKAIKSRLLGSQIQTLVNMRLIGSEADPPPIISISTKNGNFRYKYDPSIAIYAPKGYDVSREFYSPKYDVVDDSTATDFRSTVYWNPSVNIGLSGRTALSYFNGDQPGSYRMTIEGIDRYGLLGRRIYRYKVVAE